MFSFNYPNGEPQTPTRTPRFTTFGDSAFQTPKLESSFYDPRVTWDTSDPYASSPELFKTPQRFGLSTPSNQLKAQNVFSPRETNRDVASAGEHIAPGSESVRVSEGTGTARRLRLSKTDTWGNGEGPGTVQSTKSAASMQTPPPTSTSRRKAAEYDNNGAGQTFPSSSRKLSTVSMGGSHLETPSRLIGASPQLFSNLQASPDLFQFASIDQSVSPFFPQHKLFWDQETESHGDGIGLPESSNDIFSTTAGAAFGPSRTVSQDPQIPQLPTIQGSMDLPEFSDSNFGLGGTATADAALFPAPFSTSPRVPVTKAEDPAMFLSSPARRFGHPQTRVDMRSTQRGTQRQPYHHQTEESKREELRRSRSQRMPGSFSDEEDDDWTPRGLRPGLTRSLTHTAVSSHNRQQSQMSGILASTTGIRKTPSKGRTSPVKSLRQTLPRTNSATLPTRSQSLILKIGKDGRAKTEMQVVDESSTGLTDPLSGMDLDGSTTESECESAEYPINHNLFSDSKSKLSRAGSTSRPHSKGSSYSTITSSHSGRQSPWAGSSRGGSRRAPRPSLDDWVARTPRRLSMPINADFSRGTSTTTSDSLPDPNDDDGDAQHALRQVLKGRNRSRNSVVGYPSGLTRTSNTIAHLRSSPPHYGARVDLNVTDTSNSPTTVTDPDIATPSTDRQSNPSNGTRCICNSMDNGGHLMIQWYVS